MTVADLKAAGSSEVAAGANMQRLAGPVSLVSALGGASSLTSPTAAPAPKLDPTPALQDTVGWVPTAKGMLMPVIDGAQWAVHNWWWVAGIGLGVWLYAGGWMIIKARLNAARRGLNLSR